MFPDSDALCAHIASQHDTVILSFSRGKDSIAAWLQLLRHGLRVVPVHLYLIPGISFVEESLKYYQDFFGTRIYQVPHPGLFRWLNNFTFQAPEHLRVIEQMNLREYGYDELFQMTRDELGLDSAAHVALGVTRNDTLTRRTAIKVHGPLNAQRKQFFPIFDWNRARIIESIELAGVKLPQDYHLFGRSWDGLEYRFVQPIREHFPEDYARIKAIFPLIDLQLLRMEWREKWSN